MNFKTLITLLCVICLVSCGRSSKKLDAPVVRPVKVAVVQSGNNIVKTYAGVVNAQESTDLAFRVNGQIIEIPVEEGQVVQKGQLIASLDTRDLVLQNQAKKSSYITAKAQYERFQRLYAQQAVAKQDMEEAETQYELAKVEWDISENNLQDANLYAPFTGTIEKKFVENYQRISYGQSIVRLVNTEQLYVSFVIADNNMNELRKAEAKFWVRFNATGNKYFSCSIREYVDISIGGGGIPVSLWITDPSFKKVDAEIKPGISCEVKVDFHYNNHQNWVTVPITAVFIDPANEKESVWVMDANGVLQKQVVDVLGLTGKDDVMITKGLAVGEVVVSAGAFTLHEGQKVKVYE